MGIATILNLNKTYFLYSGLAIQTFEWYDTLKMINFQDNYNITDAHIEKRKFQPREKRRTILFIGILILYYIFPMSFTILFTQSETLLFRRILSTAACSLNSLFFVVVMIMFIQAAKKKQNSAYLEYRTPLKIQGTGTAMLLFVNGILNSWQWIESSQKFIDNPRFQDESALMSGVYLVLVLFQCICIAIYAMAKQKVDLFELFNKRPDVQFSIF